MPQSSPRILMILENESFPDDTRVYLEAVALVQAGFAVTVVCPTGRCRDRHSVVEGVQVYRYRQPWELGGLWGYLYEYSYSLVMAFGVSCWVLLRHGFDAVHIHTPPDINALLGIFFQFLGKKFVVDLHDLSPELYQARHGGRGSRLVTTVLHFFERLASRWADRLIATNASQQRVQIERCGADPRRCAIVRNGPPPEFTPAAEPLPHLRSPGQITIGYVGVIGVQDGVDLLLRALHEVRKARPDCVAVIVGAGPALASLRELAAELQLEDAIQFTGYVDFADVPRYIASFDLCATPDPSNPYNDSCTTIKTMEYMAVGKPTVAFATVENEITAGEAALYARNNSPAEFAARILQLVDDPGLRARMGQIGRERVVRELAWEHQRRVLVDLYRDLFAHRVALLTFGVEPQPVAEAADGHRRTSHVPAVNPAHSPAGEPAGSGASLP